MKNPTRLSKKRILISILLFLCIPLLSFFLEPLIHNHTLTQMFVINLITWILILYDWNLFALHYNRCKAEPGKAVRYTLLGMGLVGVWIWICQFLLFKGHLFPDFSSIRSYPAAWPAVCIAYSFGHAALINIGFKVMTDRFRIKGQVLLAILATAFIFGTFYTLLFHFRSVSDFFSALFFIVVLCSIQSFLCSQSHSFFPGMIATSFVFLLFQFLTMRV